MTKPKLFLLAAFLLSTQIPCFAEGQFPAGIVYGPKAAFTVKAPKGWVLDNVSGQKDGLPCVLYLKEYNWQNSPVVMYTKIASPTFTDYQSFAKWAVEELKPQYKNFQHKQIKDGKTGSGHSFFINEFYYNDSTEFSERVAYIQLPNAVAYITFQAPTSKAYQANSQALEDILKTFAYTPQYIGYHEK